MCVCVDVHENANSSAYVRLLALLDFYLGAP